MHTQLNSLSSDSGLGEHPAPIKVEHFGRINRQDWKHRRHHSSLGIMSIVQLAVDTPAGFIISVNLGCRH